MANIGAVKVRDNGKEGAEFRQWFELIVRPPFMQGMSFSMHKNEKKTDSEPDYNIWYNYNRKSEKFRGVSVGGVWKKKSKDGKTDYFSGSIESPIFPSGKLNFSMFETKVFKNEEAKDIDWIYDVIYQAPRTQRDNNSYGGGYTEPHSYTQGANGSQIPIHYETQGQAANGSQISEDEARMYM